MTRLSISLPLSERRFRTVVEAGPADAASLLTHARKVARESEFLNAGPGERALTLLAQDGGRRAKRTLSGFPCQSNLSFPMACMRSSASDPRYSKTCGWVMITSLKSLRGS